MAFDRQDLQDLKDARDKWLDVDQIIESAENILQLNELKESLKQIWNQLSFRFQRVVDEKILEIAALQTDEEKLNFIVTQAYWSYKNDILEAQKEQDALEQAQQKQQETQVEEETTTQ